MFRNRGTVYAEHATGGLCHLTFWKNERANLENSSERNQFSTNQHANPGFKIDNDDDREYPYRLGPSSPVGRGLSPMKSKALSTSLSSR
jgi:hypothetical protein